MKKILIADDSLFMRKILSDILSGTYQIVEAATGAEAKEQIKKEKPDLILLDIIMPEGEETGIRVLEDTMKAAPKTRVIMISAVGQETILDECKKLGAVDYIVKPFDKKTVISTVRKYLS
ncbi:MAG: response regulator [Candidatus Omnitrophica bacterium]|nr:response regulator [Candidatus Omnitrophota bacterium]